jgi:glycosyltransferase involved in cell wall biosynthesis
MKANKPLVSVIICTYDEGRIKDLEDCLKSLLEQDFNDFEILIVVDHNERLYRNLKERLNNQKVEVILNNSPRRGQASTMNRGIEKSHGEIVCFIDDDAVASRNWLSKIVDTYDANTVSVGGRIEPLWIGRKPSYLPEEFYWLIGATGNYLGKNAREVRNLWSGNISYRKSLFNIVGYFKEDLGMANDPLFQGEDAEFGLRLRKLTGKSVRYNPEAVVYHKIRSERVKFISLLKRAFEQGYAKAYIKKAYKNTDALSVEQDYLKLLFKSCLKRLKLTVFGPRRSEAAQQLVFTVTATSIVLLGFMVGLLKVKRIDFHRNQVNNINGVTKELIARHI